MVAATRGVKTSQPPAAAPPQPPTGSPMKSSDTPTNTFRPVGQQEELETLRQRGLAKLLNRHFTEATAKIAAEKAAAEAALRDLEERKAQASAASPTRATNRTSQWEELYMKANKWRNECRQKERETLLLYQRYVDKFGGSGHVQVPAVTAEEGSPATPRVATSVQHLEQQLENQRQDSGNIVIPSLDFLGADETFASLYGKDEEEFRNLYRQQTEQQRKTEGEGANVASPEKGTNSKDQQSPATAPTEPTKTASKDLDSEEEEEEEEEDSDEQDDDVLSLISGLTSVNSARTRRVLMDCEQTVHTFLEEESKAVQAIMSVAGHSKTSASARSSRSGAIGSLQSKAATEAENMVKQMQGILHDFEEKQKSVPKDTPPARPYYTPNPEEKWMVYYDETFRREYYHEAYTNRTQWEPPSYTDVTEVTSLSTTEQSGSVLAHVDVMPEVQKGRSLIAAYRRKSRRRRKKRLAFAAALTVTALVAGFYVCQTHPEMVVSMREQVRPAEVAIYEWMQGLRRSLEDPKDDAERVVRKNPVPDPIVEEAARQREKEEEELRRKLAEEAALKRAEEARRERQAKALAEAAAEAARLEYLRRPFGCNIPLAYLVHGRCYRLSAENPPYDAFGLVQSMMQ